MAEEIKVTGYEEFVQFMKDFKNPEGKIVNILFTGKKDENVGRKISKYSLSDNKI